MILFAIIGIFLPVLPSLTLVWLLWPRENSFQPPFPFKLILAMGLALGFSSGALLLYLDVVESLKPTYLLGEIALSVIPSAFIVWRLIVRTPATDNPFRYPVEPRSLLSYLLWGGFCFLLSLAVVNFALWSINHPHGGWEALGNWNLRAAFLFRGDEHWRNVFSPSLGSAASPMLLPCSIARIWHYVGEETAWAPSLVAMFFTFGTVGLLVTALFLIRGEIRGAMAGLFLLGTTLWIRHGGYEQADVPIGFFLLAAFVLLHFSGQCNEEGRRGLLVLAGLAAGFAAWTKDDGLWLVLALLVARAAVAAKGWMAFGREALYLGGGLLPALLMTIHHKLGAPDLPSAFADRDYTLIFHRIVEPIRYLLIGQTFVECVFSFSGGAVGLLIVLILVCGKTVGVTDRNDVATFCVFMLLAWGGCFGWSLIAPVGAHSGMEGWLHQFMNRLLLQLWPTVLFFCFLICNLPRRPHEFQLADHEMV